jgi:hypothetical protein
MEVNSAVLGYLRLGRIEAERGKIQRKINEHEENRYRSYGNSKNKYHDIDGYIYPDSTKNEQRYQRYGKSECQESVLVRFKASH